MRALLRQTLLFGVLLAIVSILYALGSSLYPSNHRINHHWTDIDLTTLPSNGVYHSGLKTSRPFAVVLNTPQRQTERQELSAHAVYPNGVDIQADLFVYATVIDENHCYAHYALTHIPAKQWSHENWYGGWYLPTCHDPSFDYAGRLINSRTHAFIASHYAGPNLPRVRYRWIDDQTIRVYFSDMPYL